MAQLILGIHMALFGCLFIPIVGSGEALLLNVRSRSNSRADNGSGISSHLPFEVGGFAVSPGIAIHVDDHCDEFLVVDCMVSKPR
jgi:hypothetical protein